MATELKKRLGLESRLVQGSGGVFDVTVDGKLVFSKKQAGRFPDVQEILRGLGKAG